MPTKSKRLFAVKMLFVVLLSLLAAYCLYAVIGQLVIWLGQPAFVSVATGETTRSAGFALQTALFAALFLLLAVADVLVSLRFFGKRRRKRERQV